MRGRIWLLASLLLGGCRDLPENFYELPLDDQIRAYEHHFDFPARLSPFTTGLYEAYSGISWHGVAAAERMIPYLKGESDALSHYEALTIILWVQNRGCSLRGTSAHRAVRSFLDSPAASEGDKRFASVYVLRSIEEDRAVDPSAIFGKKGGPCEREAAERAARAPQ